MTNSSNIIFTFNLSAVEDTELKISCPEDASISLTVNKTESKESEELISVDKVPFEELLVALNAMAGFTHPEYQVDVEHTKMLFDVSDLPLTQRTTIECVLEPKTP